MCIVLLKLKVSQKPTTVFDDSPPHPAEGECCLPKDTEEWQKVTLVAAVDHMQRITDTMGLFFVAVLNVLFTNVGLLDRYVLATCLLPVVLSRE